MIATLLSGFGATSFRTVGTKPSRMGGPGELASTVRISSTSLRLPHVLDILLVTKIGVGTCPVNDRDIPVILACIEHEEDQSPKRRESDAAADEEDVPPFHLLVWEPVAERGADTDLVSDG